MATHKKFCPDEIPTTALEPQEHQVSFSEWLAEEFKWEPIGTIVSILGFIAVVVVFVKWVWVHS